MKPAIVLISLVAVTLATWSLQGVHSSSFKLSLGQVLKEAGLEESDAPLSEEQSQIIQALSQLYASDDELEGTESEMLAQATHNPKEIMELKAIFSKHLINSLTVDKLAQQLRESLEKSRSLSSAGEKQSEQQQQQVAEAA